jgi:hypothetical protein
MIKAQLHSIDDDVDQELRIDQLSTCSGGILPAFFIAVFKGAKEIEETQRTGKLPERFNTPVSDIFKGDAGCQADGVWMPPGSDTSNNPGVWH